VKRATPERTGLSRTMVTADLIEASAAFGKSLGGGSEAMRLQGAIDAPVEDVSAAQSLIDQIASKE